MTIKLIILGVGILASAVILSYIVTWALRKKRQKEEKAISKGAASMYKCHYAKGRTVVRARHTRTKEITNPFLKRSLKYASRGEEHEKKWEKPKYQLVKDDDFEQRKNVQDKWQG